jgi:hypothetical protein
LTEAPFLFAERQSGWKRIHPLNKKAAHRGGFSVEEAG